MNKTKINTPNGVVEANELEYEVTSEPWTTVKLEDGTTVKLRVNIGKVFRLEQWDQMTGEPGYQITSKLDIRTQVPVKLKKFLQFPAASNEDVR